MSNTKRDKYDEAAEKIQALYHQGVYAGETEKISAILRSAFPPPAEDARALVQAWMDQRLPLMYQEPIALASDISRFASAQSRAQGEEAAYNHAEVFHRRLVAAQEAILDFPVVVTELVRGYGIDVNEEQIDTWLRDALNRKAEARATLERNTKE